MGNSPAFQYYPADLMSDPEVMFWDMEMIGAYWHVITYLWLTGGNFEATPEKLRQLLRKRTTRTADNLWQRISHKFVIVDGVVSHKRVTKEMQRQHESRLKRSKAGQKGMRSRWKRDNNVIESVAPEAITNDNSSTSTSTSDTTTPFGRSSNGDDDCNGQVGAVPVLNPHFAQHTRKLIDTWNTFAKNKVSPAEEMAVDREYVPLITGVPPNRFTPDELLGAVENYRHALSVPHSQAHAHTLAGFFQRQTFRKYCPGVYNPEHFDSSPHKKTGRDRDMKAEMEAYYAAKSSD